jgi:hypothetical protein
LRQEWSCDSQRLELIENQMLKKLKAIGHLMSPFVFLLSARAKSRALCRDRPQFSVLFGGLALSEIR